MYGFTTPTVNGKLNALRFVVSFNALVLAIYAFAVTAGALLALRLGLS